MLDKKETFQDVTIDEKKEHSPNYVDRHKKRVNKINLLHEKYITMESQWTCCCFTVNKGLLQFIVQTILAVQIIIFCIIQMVRLPDCESQQLYSGILGLILGILVPQPSIQNHANTNKL